MKCPKCGYLGFDDVERCRNCGYEFLLAHTASEPELPIRRAGNTPRPLEDLALLDAAASPGDSSSGPDLDAALGAPLVAKSTPRDLPLFGAAAPDDQPLITTPSPPRPPLAVRRATPEVRRARQQPPRSPALDLAFEPNADVRNATPRSAARGGAEFRQVDAADAAAADTATVSARLFAVLIDLLILAVIDATVIYFTMQICGLTMADIGVLPKGPLAAFLLVQNGGYLVAFTAGGQTLGKMAAGIRVVPSGSESTVDIGRAFVRTLVWLVLAVPAGLGFLTAVLSRDHRGLHDRLAGTRVIR